MIVVDEIIERYCDEGDTALW